MRLGQPQFVESGRQWPLITRGTRGYSVFEMITRKHFRISTFFYSGANKRISVFIGADAVADAFAQATVDIAEIS